MVNELAQWAVLVLLGVFVLGLTRQLARFMTPREEARAEAWGPPTGKPLPSRLFTDNERTQVAGLLQSTRSRAIAMVVISDACDACEAWLPWLGETNGDRATPVVVFVTAGSDATYVNQVAAVADFVIKDDPDRRRLQEAGLLATPMLLIVDDAFVVRRKQVGGDPRPAIEETEGSRHALSITNVQNGGTV